MVEHTLITFWSSQGAAMMIIWIILNRLSTDCKMHD